MRLIGFILIFGLVAGCQTTSQTLDPIYYASEKCIKLSKQNAKSGIGYMMKANHWIQATNKFNIFHKCMISLIYK